MPGEPRERRLSERSPPPPPDPFDEIIDALDGPSPGAPAPLEPVDDRLAADAAIQDAFERHVSLFACEDGTWSGMPCAFGCRYAEIEAVREGDLVRVAIDTGIRIPADRRAEANKLIMLENGSFRLSGFEPVDDSRDGAVVFAFDLDAKLVAEEYGTDRAAHPESGEGGPLDALARLLKERDEEGGLSLCFALALSTVRGFTPKFNAVAFGGKSALDVAAA
ncbi:hypothetical protein [Arabiibacter massiliensis]|uniref:hypothetical protein n=1 Tax=Arabiibacter massiliensis TaxID=1870985 RepID=UPI0009BBFFB3|nr:hypothetical protein [Arabiibacter massiliensis]